MELKSIIKNALKKKSPDELIAVSKKSELKKTLNVFHSKSFMKNIL